MASVQLHDHDPSWFTLFAQQREDLRRILGDRDFRIEHIGSTAVIGLPAKPVIDILVGAPSLRAIEVHVPDLVEAGFTYVPKYESVLPDRRYFTRQPADGLRVHVHGVIEGGPLWTAHIVFRDALRNNPQVRNEYAALKRGLAERFATDKAAYGDAKGPFIRAVITRLQHD